MGGTRTGVKCLHAHYAYYLAGGVDPVGSWVAGEIEPVHPEQGRGRVAAIDQGTNSIRLIVAEPVNGVMGELARDMVITRLGQGVDRTRRLDQDALVRTIDVLSRYCRRARALGAERIRVAATSVLRDVAGREEYASAVRELSGSELEVISGEREAGLSYLGGTFELDSATVPPPYLVVDIGGGSTEFVVGSGAGKAEHAVSTQMGSVRLTERFISSDPPGRDDVAQIENEIDRMLGGVERDLEHAREARTLVSVAGTATTMQAIALGLDRYDPDAIHRTRLSLDAAEHVLADFMRMTNAERNALVVMAPGRGDVIVAGALILIAVMRRFGFESTLVSETDILDGLAFEMLGIG